MCCNSQAPWSVQVSPNYGSLHINAMAIKSVYYASTSQSQTIVSCDKLEHVYVSTTCKLIKVIKTYSDRKIHHIVIKTCAVFPYNIGKQYNLPTIAIRQYQMALSSKGHSRLLLTTPWWHLMPKLLKNISSFPSKVFPKENPIISPTLLKI